MPKFKEFTLIIFIIIAVIILVYGLVFFNNKITGKISFELESVYEEGKPLEGTLKLSLKEGELLPASSKIVFENAGKIYEYKLNEIISDELISGNFYVEGKSLSGTGQGFGVKGEKTIYPAVYFTLNVFTEASSSGRAQEIQEEVPIEETQEQIPIEEVEEEKNLPEQAPEVAAEAKEKAQDEKITPIKRNIITDFFGEAFNLFLRLTGQVSLKLEKQTEGKVLGNEEFVYELVKGQTVEISSGSVRTDSKELPDNEILLDIQENQVIVTTTYSETEEGFGQDYLGEDAKTLSIDLSELDFITEPGELKVNLVYENKGIVSLTTSLVEGELTTVKNQTRIDLTNVTPVNITKSNVTVSKTISGLSEEERETLINEFGNISVEITKAEKTEEGFMVRFELKNFWVENHYSSEISDEKLKEQVENDRVNFLKDLARKLSEQETQKQTIEGLTGSYEI